MILSTKWEELFFGPLKDLLYASNKDWCFENIDNTLKNAIGKYQTRFMGKLLDFKLIFILYEQQELILIHFSVFPAWKMFYVRNGRDADFIFVYVSMLLIDLNVTLITILKFQNNSIVL